MWAPKLTEPAGSRPARPSEGRTPCQKPNQPKTRRAAWA
nr:MAG TPA: hypothetical protein [Caudoviricetes sp.]